MAYIKVGVDLCAELAYKITCDHAPVNLESLLLQKSQSPLFHWKKKRSPQGKSPSFVSGGVPPVQGFPMFSARPRRLSSTVWEEKGKVKVAPCTYVRGKLVGT